MGTRWHAPMRLALAEAAQLAALEDDAVGATGAFRRALALLRAGGADPRTAGPVARAAAAVALVLPELKGEELAWRLHLAFGMMFNAFAGNDVLKVFIKKPQYVSARDPETVARHLLPYVIAGLTASVSNHL